MKHPIRFVILLVLIVAIVVGACWFFLFYRPDVTAQVFHYWGDRYRASQRYERSVACYQIAEKLTPDNTNLPLILADTYVESGNYTKAEYTLVRAITDHPDEMLLYVALSRTYVAQDKLLDASRMLDRISNESVRQKITALRPSDPVISPESGYYTDYISVCASTETGRLYLCADGEFPSLARDHFEQPIELPGGDTNVTAISVSSNGLVSNVVYAGYTVGNVDEPVTLCDAVFDGCVRELLGKQPSDPILSSELWAVETLDLPDGVTALDDLGYFTGLRNLSLHNNTRLDLTAVGKLTTLRSLDLSGCTLSSGMLEMIGTLPELTSLDLSDCAIQSVDALVGLTKLQYLNIANNSVSGITALSSMTELRELHLTNNPVRTISYLNNCLQLEKLYAESCEITKLTALAGNTGLQELYCSSNEIEDISVLEDCTSLSVLDVSGNPVEDISVLPGLPELTVFKAEHAAIKSVPKFDSESSKLIQFVVNYNEITDVSGLADLQRLNYVRADYNKITDVTCLKDCYTIIEIDVWDNPVDPSGIDAMQEMGIIVNYNPDYKA